MADNFSGRTAPIEGENNYFGQYETYPEDQYQSVLTEALRKLMLSAEHPDFPSQQIMELVERNRTVYTPKYKRPLTPSEILTLCPNQWMGGEVIFAFLLEELGHLENVSILHTYFGEFLKSNSREELNQIYDGQLNTMLNRNLVIIPLHLRGNHWAFAIVYKSSDLIEYYDSLLKWDLPDHRSSITESLHKLHKILVEEKILTLPVTVSIMNDGPQQINLTDCGLYLCKTAVSLIRGESLNFGGEDLNYYRKTIVKSVLGIDCNDAPANSTNTPQPSAPSLEELETDLNLTLQDFPISSEMLDEFPVSGEMLDDILAELDKDMADAPQPSPRINTPTMEYETNQPTTMDSVSQLPITAAEVDDPPLLWKERYKDQLKYLRTTNVPFLDFNSDNILCTHNFLGNYKDCRKMSEVTVILKRQHKVVGDHKWIFLENEAKRDGRFIIDWFLKTPVYDIDIEPMSFLPGSRKALCKLIRITKRVNKHQLDWAQHQMINKKLNMFHSNPEYHKTKIYEIRKTSPRKAIKRLQNQME